MNLASTRVDFLVANNVTWDDALQFGYPDDLTWSFAGCTFLLGIKVLPTDTATLVEFTSAGGTIVVNDPVQRILSMNVPDSVIQASLPPGWYVYDLIMVNGSNRDALCAGGIQVVQGVTP